MLTVFLMDSVTQEDIFNLKIAEVGPVTHLRVRTNGAGPRSSWHLEKICVIPPTASPISSKSKAVSHGISRAGSRTFNLTGTSGNDAASPVEQHDAAQEVQPAGRASHQQQGKPVWFVAQHRLAADGLYGLEVLLGAQVADPAQSLVTYTIEVHTSDIK